MSAEQWREVLLRRLKAFPIDQGSDDLNLPNLHNTQHSGLGTSSSLLFFLEPNRRTRRRDTLRAQLLFQLSRHHAVFSSVTEVNREADQQPYQQPEPIL